MRVAALYDVHGNLPGLDVVLAEVEAARVDVIVVGGDLVMGPMPRPTLERLRARKPRPLHPREHRAGSPRRHGRQPE